jgi:hypothetical protein
MDLLTTFVIIIFIIFAIQSVFIAGFMSNFFQKLSVQVLKNMLDRIKLIFLFWTDCIDVHLQQDGNIGSY